MCEVYSALNFGDCARSRDFVKFAQTTRFAPCFALTRRGRADDATKTRPRRTKSNSRPKNWTNRDRARNSNDDRAENFATKTTAEPRKQTARRNRVEIAPKNANVDRARNSDDARKFQLSGTTDRPPSFCDRARVLRFATRFFATDRTRKHAPSFATACVLRRVLRTRAFCALALFHVSYSLVAHLTFRRRMPTLGMLPPTLRWLPRSVLFLSTLPPLSTRETTRVSAENRKKLTKNAIHCNIKLWLL